MQETVAEAGLVIHPDRVPQGTSRSEPRPDAVCYRHASQRFWGEKIKDYLRDGGPLRRGLAPPTPHFREEHSVPMIFCRVTGHL